MAENTNFNNNELLIILKEKSDIQNDIEMINEIISSNKGKIL